MSLRSSLSTWSSLHTFKTFITWNFNEWKILWLRSQSSHGEPRLIQDWARPECHFHTKLHQFDAALNSWARALLETQWITQNLSNCSFTNFDTHKTNFLQLQKLTKQSTRPPNSSMVILILFDLQFVRAPFVQLASVSKRWNVSIRLIFVNFASTKNHAEMTPVLICMLFWLAHFWGLCREPFVEFSLADSWVL